MNSVQTSKQGATGSPPVEDGQLRLEVVVVPVSDVDRAKRSCESMGWRLVVRDGTKSQGSRAVGFR